MNTKQPLIRTLLPLLAVGGLAGCTNHLTTRVHVYNPAQRHDELKRLIQTGVASKDQQQRYQQLDRILSQAQRGGYNATWHDRVATLIDSHSDIAERLAKAARASVDKAILTPKRDAIKDTGEKIAAHRARLIELRAMPEPEPAKKVTARSESTPPTPVNGAVSPAVPVDIPKTAPAAVVAKQDSEKTSSGDEKIEIVYRDAAAVTEAHADSTAENTAAAPVETDAPLESLTVAQLEARIDKLVSEQKDIDRDLTIAKNEIDPSLDAYANNLTGIIQGTRAALDAAYTTYLSSQAVNREDILALTTRELFEDFLTRFWTASDYDPAEVQGRDSFFATMKIEIPPVLANFYDVNLNPIRKAITEKALAKSDALAGNAARPPVGRDTVIRNDMFEESVTHPLVTFAQRDAAGWTCDVATARMEANIKSAVVVVRDTPSSYSIVSYDGDAASTVSEGLRATANTALLALEAARMAAGAPVPLPKPKGSEATSAGALAAGAATASTGVPSDIYKAIARDRLTQASTLAKETPATPANRAEWASRVRELLSSTPFLPEKAQ